MDFQENEMIVTVVGEDFNEWDVADCVQLISPHMVRCLYHGSRLF